MNRRSVPAWVLAFLAVVSGGAASAGDGLVALQTADGSCPDDSGDRYVDCGNGTVTDNETGLVWLANANCFGRLTWDEAMGAVVGLSDLPRRRDSTCFVNRLTDDQCDCGLRDGSSPGEWRLPSIEEWQAMAKYAADVLGCFPAITNDRGDGCWSPLCVRAGECSFYSVDSTFYWSSSPFVPDPTARWIVAPGDAPFPNYKWQSWLSWPVRGGQ